MHKRGAGLRRGLRGRPACSAGKIVELEVGSIETPWRFWVDRGGTFTDVVALAPDGAMHRAKLLSEDPERYEDAAIEAMRRISGVGNGVLPPAELRLGTTVATNALLERKGEPVLLAITRGFRDALLIGTQERPELFARHIVRDPPLYSRVAEVAERVTAGGDIVTPLDEAAARGELQSAYDEGLRAIAIVLMHGWRHKQHEERLAEIAREIGYTQISVSHQVAPLIKLIARGETCVVDAYLSPVVQAYVGSLERRLGAFKHALYMQSNGGLVEGVAFRGSNAILSGPAGGIVGMAATAKEAGYDHVIGFDMGGTSTDVSHFAGSYERDSETRVGGTRIRTPMMRIHTVAAGGGSICRFDGVRFQVGPESAGAVPGPASYRRGGPLTVTDCNLLLGKLQTAHFPSVFGRNGDEPLDAEVVHQKFAELVASVGATGRTYTPEQAAEGFVTIAVANMANAIKTISLRRGHDVTRAALVSFGGAGGQHACLVADALGISEVMCHPLASVLSAYGMGLADRRTLREATLALPLDRANEAAIETAVESNRLAALEELAGQGSGASNLRSEATLFLRPPGSESTLEVPFGALEDMRASFERAWQTRFGFAAEGVPIAETLRVEAIAENETPPVQAALPARSSPPIETVELYSGGQRRKAQLFRREGLAAGFEGDGPILVVDEVSTIVVETGWRLRVDALGNLIMTRRPREGGETLQIESMPTAAAQDHALREVDPVRLEIMGALFMAIAEEMGAALQASASSVNIRERLDFSCALFDRHGNLVANAPHMPVHLGSMGESVRTIIRRRGGAQDGRGILPGDVYALNAPYEGGTHLPDITVMMPVFAAEGEAEPAWYVAARGHHADIGGIAPGSMPPDSRTVDEEGVLLDNVLLVDRGRLLEGEIRDLLRSGPLPARDPNRNLADLKAQIAACAKGAAELRRIAGEQGRALVDTYMDHVQQQAEDAVRALLGRLNDGSFKAPMDNGAEIRVSFQINRDAREATIDFTGSSAQLGDNFNAPLPVVRAAVLYVVRTLIDDAVPMNEGCLRPLRLIVPEGSMLHPVHPAAVVAGNVETSQIITDALFGALGAMAASQGTMNNFTFGNDRYQYYETIAGGSGAGPDFPGADAIQTHMTNSRLTDPEVLESNFPVLLEEFSVRLGSGGEGAWKGGDGAIRKIRFLEAMSAGILSGRRLTTPFGLDGGRDGQAGANRILRKDGVVDELASSASTMMQPGDTFIIETPGGGGYGRRSKPPPSN